jgi:P-type Ca2+ transporter type 2C
MRRPPREPGARLLAGRSLARAALEGLIALAFTIGIYWTTIAASLPEPRTRLLAFTALLVANLSLIFFTRSGGRRVWRHIVAGNRSLWIIVLAIVAAYAAVVALPALRAPFRMTAPTLADAAIIGVGTLLLWCGLAVLQLVQSMLTPHAGATSDLDAVRP